MTKFVKKLVSLVSKLNSSNDETKVYLNYEAIRGTMRRYPPSIIYSAISAEQSLFVPHVVPCDFCIENS